MRPNHLGNTPQTDLFRSRLDNIINMRHELVKLAKAIDWEFLENKNAGFYAPEGRPGVKARLMIGLQLLKQMYNLSDEGVCERWVHDPYFQYFCGEEYFQHAFPMERSSMTHWRKRVGDEFCEVLAQASLSTAHKTGALRIKDVAKIVVDTTVQEKAITFPTDAKLYYKALLALGRLAKKQNVNLRQHYARVGKRTLVMASRYQHAKQMKRAAKSVRKLKTYLGRVIRDIERKIVSNDQLSKLFLEPLKKAKRIYAQQRQDSDKLYSWHAPEVECISKGKAHKPYEFGCKVSVTTTVNPAPAGHFVLHTAALHGRPYDGHTLNQVITQATQWIGKEPRRIYVDKGYRGHNYPHKFRVFKSGQKRGITAAIKKELKRRSVVEPLIGHLKNDGRLGRNYLKGISGDKINALMVAAGYNFRLLLKWLRKILRAILFSYFYRIRMVCLLFHKSTNLKTAF